MEAEAEFLTAARLDPDVVVLEGLHALKHALRFGAEVLRIAGPDPDAVLALADSLSSSWQAGITGFAAGALLVMLTDSMIPESRERAGLPAGLVLVLGFAVAAGLSVA